MSKNKLLAARLSFAYDNVLDASRKLSTALSDLSRIASDILGEQITADLCSGSEIEFRRNNKDGYVSDFDCLSLEDILGKLH